MSMSMSETTTERALDLEAEVARLTVCLKKSNDGFEEYERKYYLEMNAREEAEEEVKLLRYGIEAARKLADTYEKGVAVLLCQGNPNSAAHYRAQSMAILAALKLIEATP